MTAPHLQASLSASQQRLARLLSRERTQEKRPFRGTAASPITCRQQLPHQ